jgi:predicted amidophosphoribosyltransferase
VDRRPTVNVARALLDLVLPVTCAGCDDAPTWLCPRCRQALAGRPREVVPAPAPAGLPPVRAVAAYDGVVRQLLLAHKEDGVLRLAGPLGAALSRAAGELVPSGRQGFVVVPVPSSRASVRARGNDPTLRMARAAARALSGARLLPALRHVRPVADQSGLGLSARRANLAGALAVRRRAGRLLDGRTVLIVDDLMTTGSTLVEAARAIRAAGGHVLGAAVVAATRRRPRPW